MAIFCPYEHSWRGQLRHVCRHTNHRVTVIYTFLESPNDIDVKKTLAEPETQNNYIYSLWLN